MKSVIIGCLFLVLVKSDQSLSWWDEDLEDMFLESRLTTRDVTYRLPETVVPLEYDVDLELFFHDTTFGDEYTYNGTVKIIIQPAVEETNQIVLHSNVDQVTEVSLYSDDGLPVNLNVLRPIVIEAEYHFLRINVAQSLIVGTNYTLVIEYASTMNEGPLNRGIWKGKYKDENGEERIYATTHFQPYNARQAFPCWDEPLYKAVFTLHLTTPEGYTGIFTNTGFEYSESLTGEKVKHNFLSTPPMSSYLLTFLVSETFTVLAEDTNHEPPIRIIARSNAEPVGHHALELAVRLTDHFDEYFDYPYSTIHPNLLNDHVASPDWASAGTENWGMVSYREVHLLVDVDESIMSVEHYTATLVSHELAHKWFGNLVTCYWWSNTWINEGFASYFGYMATNAVFPQYEMHEHFNSRYLQTSLAFDSNVGTVALNHEVSTPSQVTGHFGTISYSKGAAFLRMTADIISEETFRKTCIYFLKDNEFKPTDQYDLYDAFDKAITEDESLNDYIHFNFTNYYSTWVNEPGYPILNVNVNRDSGEMELTQERFFLNPSANPTGQIYPIPITYSTKSNPSFDVLKPKYIIEVESAVIPMDNAEEVEWVIFNNKQHGHYRVNYDNNNWNLIAEALINEPNSIHHLNRAQIVDDVFALMRSQRITFAFGFNILQFLRNETNYHVWNPAISGFTWLRNRLRHLPENQKKLDDLVLTYMEHVIEDLGFNAYNVEETPTMAMTRQEVLHFACMVGHERCIHETQSRFIGMRDESANVHPGIRRSVYITGVREGGVEDYRFLLSRFYNSNLANDRLEMLRALGATRHTELLNEYLAMTLTDEVRDHDKVNAFNFALLGNQENAATVLEFVIDNIDEIRTAYVANAPNAPVHSALSNLASFLDENGLLEMEDWLRSTQIESPQYSSATSALASAWNNIEWGNRNVDQIMAAINNGSPQVISILLIAIMSLVSLNL